jgi:hypothetical protein
MRAEQTGGQALRPPSPKGLHRPGGTGTHALCPLVGFAVMAATIVVGGIGGAELGLPAPPFIGRWAVAVDAGWAPAAAAVLGAGVWLGPRLVASAPPAVFAGALFALTLAARLALGAANRGPDEWSRVFALDGFEGPNEYLPALSALQYGADWFLDRFAELVPALPVHSAGHPPGLLLVMHWTEIDTAGELAALCIVTGSFVAPLAYATARTVLPEQRARLAGLLTALAPSVLLFGATSADAVYATLGMLAAWPLCSQRTGARLAGAALLALGTFFAWSLLAIGAWAAIMAWRRSGFRDMLALGLLCGAVLLAAHVAVAAATGYDPIGTLRATEAVYRYGIADRRPYWYWLPGSPTAFLLMLGLPVAWYALRALGAGEDTALAIFAVIAVAAVAGFTKAEVERIWLFLAPLACIAAAAAMQADRLRLVLVLLAAQALAWELVRNTVW